MKTIYFILLSGLLLVFPGCMDDKGNYDYKNAEEVAPGSISGIDTEYTVITLDKLNISPEVKDAKPAYEYRWYAYPLYSGNSKQDKWVLGTSKDLDYQMVLAAGKYHLIFEVKDTEYNTVVSHKSTLDVVSEYTRGWFILKDKDDITDVDFIKYDGVQYNNILKSLHGSGLPGQGVNMGLQMDYYSYIVTNPDGTVTKEYSASGFFVLSDRDMRSYNANTMELIYNLDDVFLESPKRIDIQRIYTTFYGVYLVNNGKVHTMSNNSFGMFGYHLPGDYDIAAPALTLLYNGVLVFDRNSSSFKGIKRVGKSFFDLKGDRAAPCNNMDCDMIYMEKLEPAMSSAGNSKALGIMKKRSSGDHYAIIVDDKFVEGLNPIKIFDKIQADKQILNAKVYGVNNWNEIIYFSTGDNKISYYKISSQEELELAVDIPADEQVTYMRDIHDYGMHKFIVGTSKGTQWKLYVYNFKGYTPEINGRFYPEPFAGEGNIRHVIYRSTYSGTID